MPEPAPLLPGTKQLHYCSDGQTVQGPVSADEYVQIAIDKLKARDPAEPPMVLPDFLAQGTDQWQPFEKLPDIWMSPTVRQKLAEATASFNSKAHAEANKPGQIVASILFLAFIFGIIIFLAS